MHFDVLNPNIVVPCPNLTACLRISAIFDFLHLVSLMLQVAPRITRVSKVVIGQNDQYIGVLRGPMLHMSSTHQMQQIHPNDLTLICPYVGNSRNHLGHVAVVHQNRCVATWTGKGRAGGAIGLASPELKTINKSE